jgi:hypothetical protein
MQEFSQYFINIHVIYAQFKLTFNFREIESQFLI